MCGDAPRLQMVGTKRTSSGESASTRARKAAKTGNGESGGTRKAKGKNKVSPKARLPCGTYILTKSPGRPFLPLPLKPRPFPSM